VKSFTTVKNDVRLLAGIWPILKIIDDDFLQSYRTLTNLSVKGLFKEVIVETRPDRINPDTIAFMQQFGVTHIILGVEAFNNQFISLTGKSQSDHWEKIATTAIELSIANNFIVRPVVMLTGPALTLEYEIAKKGSIPLEAF
jgi:histone acetyltransferase (RNA polymerase elongator complex component)